MAICDFKEIYYDNVKVPLKKYRMRVWNRKVYVKNKIKKKDRDKILVSILNINLRGEDNNYNFRARILSLENIFTRKNVEKKNC